MTFKSLVNQKDIPKIQEYLSKNILFFESQIYTNDDKIKNILEQYTYLKLHIIYNIYKFHHKNKYISSNIYNVFMIITLGYLPLLKHHLDSNHDERLGLLRDIYNNNILHYAINKSGNYKIVKYLLRQNYNNKNLLLEKNKAGKTPIMLLDNLPSTEKERYQNLFKLYYEKNLYYENIPEDLLILIIQSPKVLDILCKASKSFEIKYCLDGNSHFWINMYKYYISDNYKIDKNITLKDKYINIMNEYQYFLKKFDCQEFKNSYYNKLDHVHEESEAYYSHYFYITAYTLPKFNKATHILIKIINIIESCLDFNNQDEEELNKYLLHSIYEGIYFTNYVHKDFEIINYILQNDITYEMNERWVIENFLAGLSARSTKLDKKPIYGKKEDEIIYDITEKVRSLGVLTDYSFEFIAKYGNIELLKNILSKIDTYNVNTFTSILYGAASGGHLDIIIYILDNFDHNFPEKYLYTLLQAAALNGYIDIIKYTLNRFKVEDIYKYIFIIIKFASIGNNLDIINYIFNNYIKIISYDIIEKSMMTACKNGNIDILLYMFKKYEFKNMKELIRKLAIKAIKYQQNHILDLMINFGADNYNEMISIYLSHDFRNAKIDIKKLLNLDIYNYYDLPTMCKNDSLVYVYADIANLENLNISENLNIPEI